MFTTIGVEVIISIVGIKILSWFSNFHSADIYSVNNSAKDKDSLTELQWF